MCLCACFARVLALSMEVAIGHIATHRSSIDEIVQLYTVIRGSDAGSLFKTVYVYTHCPIEGSQDSIAFMNFNSITALIVGADNLPRQLPLSTLLLICPSICAWRRYLCSSLLSVVAH
jgi:hypothetical protein